MTIRLPSSTHPDNKSGRETWVRNVHDALGAVSVQLNALSSASVPDGDKGDIVVSGSGTVWSFDTGVVTAFAKTFLDDANAGAVRTTIGAAATSHTHTQADVTGLTTADSPQFTALNVGHASDTTVSRVSAGVIAVEGVTLLTTATGQPLDATLTALAAYNTNGIVCQTAADTFAGRTLTAPAAGITVSNGGGVAGNPTLALADDLNAVEGLSTTGLAARTAASTWTTRTVTAGTGIGVTNGDGVSGNPTIAMSLVGAMVKKSADQTGANYSAGANIAWDAEVYDTSTIHDNATNNSRLTTPAGATYVQVGCNLRFVNVTASTDIILLIQKTGSSVFDGACGIVTDADSTSPRISVCSGPIPVTGGTDYFEANLTCSDTSIDITASVSNFWMRVLA